MRLFIAIDFPQAVIQQIIPLLNQITAGRPIPFNQLHLTLKFLGETSPASFEMIKDLLDQTTVEPFTTTLKGVGCFPSIKRPRVLWVGMESCPPLSQLKEKIDHALQSLGIEEEGRPFHPHLTLARFKKPQPGLVSGFLTKNLAFQTESFPIDNFHLYSSKLTPKGAIHTREKTIHLGQGDHP